VAAVGAAAFVALGTVMALAGSGASSSTPPRANRAVVDPFTQARAANNGLYDGVALNNNDVGGGSWSAQPSAASGRNASANGGALAFGGSSSGADTATRGS
jgi:hypothetical protein